MKLAPEDESNLNAKTAFLIFCCLERLFTKSGPVLLDIDINSLESPITPSIPSYYELSK